MIAIGIGNDGYVRVQNEATYGTAATGSMTLLPVTAETLVNHVVEPIEQNNVIASRIQQAPCQGRNVNSGVINIDAHPTLVGTFFHYFDGNATDTANGTAFNHVWLARKIGESSEESFTLQQALGTGLADQFSGGVVTSLTISGDNSGKVNFNLDCIFQSHVADVARISTFTFPVQTPFNFGHGILNIDPDSEAAFDQDINSFELTLDYGYDLERFKFGSFNIKRPVFNTIPSVTFTANIDAERQFLTFARSYEPSKLSLTFTHTEEAGSGVPFEFIVEIPGAQLNPETEIPNGNDRLSMDISFIGYGGTTTNSSGLDRMWDVLVTDNTPAYDS